MSETRALINFDAAVRNVANKLREELARYDTVHSMDLDIDISGRTDGDLNISYRLSLNYENATKGGNLARVVDEAIRREGWGRVNSPICLPKAETKDHD